MNIGDSRKCNITPWVVDSLLNVPHSFPELSTGRNLLSTSNTMEQEEKPNLPLNRRLFDFYSTLQPPTCTTKIESLAMTRTFSFGNGNESPCELENLTSEVSPLQNQLAYH
jgi:hypothetical protein